MFFNKRFYHHPELPLRTTKCGEAVQQNCTEEGKVLGEAQELLF